MNWEAEQAGREDHTHPAARVKFRLRRRRQKADLDNVKKVACPFTQFPPRRDSVGRSCLVYHTTSINL